jgi:hypothetical protein
MWPLGGGGGAGRDSPVNSASRLRAGWLLAQAPLPGHSLVLPVHLLAQPRGNLGFPDDPSAQRRRGIAPKNIATFVNHTEALEPMAGTLWTSYDASFPATSGGDEKARQSRQTS